MKNFLLSRCTALRSGISTVLGKSGCSLLVKELEKRREGETEEMRSRLGPQRDDNPFMESTTDSILIAVMSFFVAELGALFFVVC
jgi:recombinational DNA repair ATPase RecF